MGVFMDKKFTVLLSALVLIFVFSGIVAFFILKQSTPKCDSKYAEDTVLSIYEEQSFLYNSYKEYIDHISLDFPQATSYDKNIEKYTCEGIITFHAKENSEGFQYVNPWGNIDSGAKYSQIECPITYTIAKSRDEFVIQSTLCNWGDISYKNRIKKDKKTDDNQNIKQTEIPIYEKIGVSKDCLEVWQIVQAEGYYPSKDGMPCSDDDYKKVDNFCSENADACYE